MLRPVRRNLIRKVPPSRDASTSLSTNRPPATSPQQLGGRRDRIDRKLRRCSNPPRASGRSMAEPGKPFDPREHEPIVNVPGPGRAEARIRPTSRRRLQAREIASAAGPRVRRRGSHRKSDPYPLCAKPNLPSDHTPPRITDRTPNP